MNSAKVLKLFVLLVTLWIPLFLTIFVILEDESAVGRIEYANIGHKVRHLYLENTLREAKERVYLESVGEMASELFYVLSTSLFVLSGATAIWWEILQRVVGARWEFLGNLLLWVSLSACYIVQEFIVLFLKDPQMNSNLLWKILSQEILTFFLLVLAAPLAYWISKKMNYYSMFVYAVLLTTFIYANPFIVDMLYSTGEKIVPLAENVQFRDDLFSLAENTGFPVNQIYRYYDSKTEEPPNAYYTGYRIIINDQFFNKRYVCRNTVSIKPPDNSNVADCEKTDYYTRKEILAILAHELGHWNGSHMSAIVRNRAMATATVWVLSDLLYQKGLVRKAFDFQENRPVPVTAGILLTSFFIYTPFSRNVYSLYETSFRRKQELEADNYAKSMGYSDALITSLIKLTEEMRCMPDRGTMYSKIKLSHPTLLERIETLSTK